MNEIKNNVIKKYEYNLSYISKKKYNKSCDDDIDKKFIIELLCKYDVYSINIINIIQRACDYCGNASCNIIYCNGYGTYEIKEYVLREEYIGNNFDECMLLFNYLNNKIKNSNENNSIYTEISNIRNNIVDYINEYNEIYNFLDNKLIDDVKKIVLEFIHENK